MASLPVLVVVSGPMGSGKTTLAHRLARSVGCPAICRDEIKEGMVHTTSGFVARGRPGSAGHGDGWPGPTGGGAGPRPV